MRHYRTEIVIPNDRSVVLQLPEALPTGRAVVTIQVQDGSPSADDWLENAVGIEWWDEFGDVREGEGPGDLPVRLAALEP